VVLALSQQALLAVLQVELLLVTAAAMVVLVEIQELFQLGKVAAAGQGVIQGTVELEALSLVAHFLTVTQLETQVLMDLAEAEAEAVQELVLVVAEFKEGLVAAAV
jgi:hypothetical protein